MARQSMYDRVAGYGATYDNQAYDQKKKAPTAQPGGYNPQSAANAGGAAAVGGAPAPAPAAVSTQHRSAAGAFTGAVIGGAAGFFSPIPGGLLKGASAGAAAGDAMTGGGVFTPSTTPPPAPEQKFTIPGVPFPVNAAQREQLRQQAEAGVRDPSQTPDGGVNARKLLDAINGVAGAPAGSAPAASTPAPGVVPAPQNATALGNAAADEYVAQLAGKTTLADQAYIDRARAQAEVQKQQAAQGLGARGQGGNEALLTYANTQIDRGTNENVSNNLRISKDAARENAVNAYGKLMEPTLQSQQLANQGRGLDNQVYGAQLNYTLAAAQAQTKQNIDALDQLLKLGQIGYADYTKKRDEELANLNAATEASMGSLDLPSPGYGALADPLAGHGYGQAGYALPGRR